MSFPATEGAWNFFKGGLTMKKIFVPLLIAGILSITHTSFAQSPPVNTRNVIITEGIGEVKGQNDSARISIGVLTEGKRLEEVSSENALKTKKVLKVIKGLAVENLTLKTSNYRVNPRRDYQARPPKINGYEITNTIEIILEGFEPEDLSTHCSTIIGKALESGANNINRLNFYIKNKSLLEKEALTQATQAAIQRAETLANAAGVKLKRITSLSTQPMHPPPAPQRFMAAEMDAKAAAGAPPIEIGETQIRFQVTVTYEME
jgi:uncharacterized protein YggE